MKKQLRITEKTKNNLINSFWELYKKNNLNKIVINELCNNASYERTTFYRYFNDIEDILNQLEDSIINAIKKDIENNIDNKKDSNILIDRFKNFSSKYGEYIVVFCDKGNTSFYSKFKNLIKKDVFDYMNIGIKDESKKEFLFEFVFSSLINSYSYWYKHQKEISLDSFINFTNTMILNGTKSIMTFNK